MRRFGSQRWTATSIVACLSVGCASVGVPTVGPSAPLANVLHVGQFAITTDFSLDENDPLVLDLMGMREHVRKTLELPLGETVVRVVIFSSRREYEEFLRVHYPELPPREAFFVRHGDDGLIIYARLGPRLRRDLRHEGTHALLHATAPTPPLWLDEGLAEYFEAGTFPDAVNPQHVRRLAQQDREGRFQPNLADLARLEDLREMSPDDYRESWLWIHFCLHGSEARRVALRQSIAEMVVGQEPRLEERLRAIEPAIELHLVEHLRRIATSVPADSYLDPQLVDYPVPWTDSFRAGRDRIRNLLQASQRESAPR